MERPRPRIDPHVLRARLERLSSPERDEETVRRILLERARRVGAPEGDERRVTEPAVAFETSGERYAVPTAGVFRVERAGAIVRLPGAPPFVLGVIPVRNRSWPLLDLPALLGRAGTGSDAPRWALLLGTTARLALAADTVSLVELALGALHPLTSAEGFRRGWTDDGRTVLEAEALAAHALRRLRGNAA